MSCICFERQDGAEAMEACLCAVEGGRYCAVTWMVGCAYGEWCCRQIGERHLFVCVRAQYTGVVGVLVENTHTERRSSMQPGAAERHGSGRVRQPHTQRKMVAVGQFNRLMPQLWWGGAPLHRMLAHLNRPQTPQDCTQGFLQYPCIHSVCI